MPRILERELKVESSGFNTAVDKVMSENES